MKNKTKTTKSLLSLLLASALIFSLITLNSCSGSGSEVTTSTTTGISTTAVPATTAETTMSATTAADTTAAETTASITTAAAVTTAPAVEALSKYQSSISAFKSLKTYSGEQTMLLDMYWGNFPQKQTVTQNFSIDRSKKIAICDESNTGGLITTSQSRFYTDGYAYTHNKIATEKVPEYKQRNAQSFETFENSLIGATTDLTAEDITSSAVKVITLEDGKSGTQLEFNLSNSIMTKTGSVFAEKIGAIEGQGASGMQYSGIVITVDLDENDLPVKAVMKFNAKLSYQGVNISAKCSLTQVFKSFNTISFNVPTDISGYTDV